MKIFGANPEPDREPLTFAVAQFESSADCLSDSVCAVTLNALWKIKCFFFSPALSATVLYPHFTATPCRLAANDSIPIVFFFLIVNYFGSLLARNNARSLRPAIHFYPAHILAKLKNLRCNGDTTRMSGAETSTSARKIVAQVFPSADGRNCTYLFPELRIPAQKKLKTESEIQTKKKIRLIECTHDECVTIGRLTAPPCLRQLSEAAHHVGPGRTGERAGRLIKFKFLVSVRQCS